MIDFAAIERLVRHAIGFDVESIGRGAFENTLRAALAGAENDDVLALLERSPEAFESLVEQLVVPETWFFRDREPFLCLVKELRPPRPGDRPLRILSVPCASGEEPYSIAMALLDAGFPEGSFLIDAVDLSRRALAAAREGRYTASSFRGERRDEHFLIVDGVYELKARVRNAVRFQQGNLCARYFLPGEAPYDAIFCRNLLIYLVPEARKVALGHLRRLLAPEGILFAGHAEMSAFLAAGHSAIFHRGAFACRRARRDPAKPERIKPRRPETSAEPERPGGEDLLTLARRLSDRGELAEASALCDRVLDHERDNVEAYYLKGLIEQARGQSDRAVEYLRKALYLSPSHYEALLQMSNLSHGRGDADQGALYLQRARRAGRKLEDDCG